jgi:hypothetical protein
MNIINKLKKFIKKRDLKLNLFFKLEFSQNIHIHQNRPLNL